MFIWLCVCRLTGSARIKVGSSKSAPVRAVQPPPSLFSLLSLSLSLSVCLRSYFYLRGELECCQIVILLLRCVFIHSIRIHIRLPSSPLSPNVSASLPPLVLTPFPLGNFCACVNPVDCVAPSSATRRRRRQFVCVFSVLSCSIYPSVLRTDVLFKRTLLLFHFDEPNPRTPYACAHHTKPSKVFSYMKVAWNRV